VSITEIAELLARLTAGWTTDPAQKPESLDIARKALAASLVMGKEAAEIHPGRSSLPIHAPESDVITSLENLIAGAPELAKPTILGLVRSASALDPNNPSGLPAWARGMEVQESYGPFIDANGVTHFVDIIPLTLEASVAFGSSAGIFGVFPVKVGIIEPGNELALGKGSVWFAAHLLVHSLPPNSFSGFRITGGLLKASAPFQLQGTVYVLPANATVTLTATLDPPAVPPGGSSIGQDAEADTVQLPKTVTIGFSQVAAAIEALDSSSATVYGTTFNFIRNANPPISFNNDTAILVPCTSSIASFSFTAVHSTEFTPSGTAAVAGTGSALPVAQTTPGALGQAAGAGSLLMGLGTGASAKWQLHPAVVPIVGWQIFVDPTQIIVIAGGVGPSSVLTTYKLWPERAPSKRNSSIDFFTPAGFLITFVSTSGSETLIGLGLAIAHFDRPLAADGMRYGLQAPASISIAIKSTGTQVTIFALAPPSGGVFHPIQPLALENALIGVESPYGFLLSGPVSGTNFSQCGIAVFFNARWLLPTLPDPYASNFRFDPTKQTPGTLTGVAIWTGGDNVALSFVLSPANQAATHAQAGGSTISSQGQSPDQPGSASLTSPFAPHAPAQPNAASIGGFTALLDLSTKVDLFGVAIIPADTGVGGIAGRDQIVARPEAAVPQQASAAQQPAPAPATSAPPFGITGLSLAFNGATCATFALPQVSWEPMESTALPSGPIFCNPPSDGPPLVLIAPDEQQLVPLAPAPVLLNNISNVAAGKFFNATFSLPFGLVAHIRQPNEPPPPTAPKGTQALFLNEGGEFQLNMPSFPSSLQGALQATVKPPFPQNSNAMFSGNTTVDSSGGTPRVSGYGFNVLSASGATIFQNEFDTGGFSPGIPLRRIDLAGYGASIFSEWADNTTAGPHVTKVDFDTVLGRTAFEVVQVATVLYHYGINLVRTITIERQGAGWIKRTDTGWRATSNGLFTFPNAADFANRVHRGAVAGVFNVRNIREVENYIFVPPGSASPPGFEFKQVLFDADIGLDHRVSVLQGGSPSSLTDADGNPVTLVPARDLIGYVQLGPVGVSPDSVALQGLFQQTGPITAAFSCLAQIGSLGPQGGTLLRCSAIEGNMASASTGSSPVPALAAALRSAPVLPHDGAWGFGQRRPNEPGPSPLAHDFPVPLVQPTTDPNNWHVADIVDVLRLDSPGTLYGILQDTGTQKLLFEQPKIPLLGTSSPPGSTPGIQLPNPPNFADVASLLNSTGLFPDIGNTIALLGGLPDQLQNAGDGLKYSKTVTFDPKKPALTLLDLGVLQVALSYCDASKGRDGAGNANAPTKLTYNLDPAAAKRWSFEIDNLSFLVFVPQFSASDALLTIIGGMVADDQTKPTLSNLNLVYGSALDSLKSIFSKLQKLAQFLPGGAGAGLNVALANGKLTVIDTFTLPTLPLGLGELSDIGIDVGLALTLSPLSADFIIGVGGPDNPFHWIVSPLAGTGLIDVGVKDGKPELTVQGGIGLGLAIDLAIAEGSASITIAVQLDVTGSTITVIFILNGQASVDVLGGLASASITLTAAVGVSVNPLPVPVPILSPPGFDFPAEDLTFLASVSVGIHISICWVVNVDFDGSWQFSQSIHTPEIKVLS
jgi:hypothetical protein